MTFETVAFLTMLLAVGVAAIEAVLAVTWRPIFYRWGVPLLRREGVASNPGAGLPDPPELEERVERIESSRWAPLVIRQVAAGRYGFRESYRMRLGRRTYTPVMHGLLHFDRENGRVVVRGLANWSPIVFTIPFVALCLQMPWAWIMIPFAVGFLAFVYGLQARRFEQVAKAASQLWSAPASMPAGNVS